MKLIEAGKYTNFNVKRDGQFFSLGFVTHKSDDMLVFVEDRKYIARLLENPRIKCAITLKNLISELPKKLGVAVCDCPRKTFYELHNYLANNTDFYWTDFASDISDEAMIDSSAYVAPKNVRIGKGVIIEPRAVVLAHSIIGDNVILRAGCIIGAHGFEFKRLGGEILPIAHAGGVLLREKVEIQSNSNIGRSVFGGFTEIGAETKIDSFVHVGHNVRIGNRCLIAATTVVGGSTIIGDDVWIGPGSTITSEIRIGDGAHVTIGSVVTQNVEAGQRVTGNFAIDHDRFIAFLKTIR